MTNIDQDRYSPPPISSMVCSLAAVLAVGLLPVNVLFAMMCQLVCCNDRDRLFTRIKIDLTTYYQPAHQNPAFVCFSPPLCCHCRCCHQRLCSFVVVLVLPLSLPMLPTWWLIWMGNGNNDDGVFRQNEGVSWRPT